MKHIVVIGAGQAGASLVAKLRALGETGAVTLIGAEPAPPYQRPPLSKAYLLGEMPADRLFLRPASFYADQNIALRLGETVTAIDTVAQTVTLGAEVMPYDELALTTGSMPRRLPDSIGGALKGVFCRAIGAVVADVRVIKSVGASSTSSPRRPADTSTVACVRAEASMTVRSGLRWAIGLTPPTT